MKKVFLLRRNRRVSSALHDVWAAVCELCVFFGRYGLGCYCFAQLIRRSEYRAYKTADGDVTALVATALTPPTPGATNHRFTPVLELLANGGGWADSLVHRKYRCLKDPIQSVLWQRGRSQWHLL